MNTLHKSFSISLSALLCSAALATDDTAHGRQLHDMECLLCHTATQYTRAERRVDSLEKLRARVAYCRDDVGAEWDADATEQVVQYLNGYYHF